jgi:hypothetical protein
MKLGRNDPCMCGSGRKVKRCCGTDASRHRAETAEELVALAFHFPRYRPQTDAFDAWAHELMADQDDGAVADGIAVLDADERKRIVGGFACDHPEAWRSLLDDFVDEELAGELLLIGAIAAGVAERRDLGEALSLLEDGDVDSLEALATAIPGEDVWSVVESAETAEALDAVPDELDDDEYERRWTEVLDQQISRLRTPWHDTRLDTLVARVRGALPDTDFPIASRVLLDACERLAELREPLLAALLSDSLDRIYTAEPPADFREAA